MDTQMLLYISLGAHAFSILLIVWFAIRINKLTKGGDGKSLEQHIETILNTHQKHTNQFSALDAKVQSLQDKMRSAVRKVSTIRFDPLDGMGDGKQSFVVALLDDEGNGAVISSLNARDKVRVFAKPIQQFTSTHELSEEEKRAVQG